MKKHFAFVYSMSRLPKLDYETNFNTTQIQKMQFFGDKPSNPTSRYVFFIFYYFYVYLHTVFEYVILIVSCAT